VHVQSITSGQQLLAVPLRLALKDYADDPEAAAHSLADAPWAVRLAAKLLREMRSGPASQWAPYLQVSDTFLKMVQDALRMDLTELRREVLPRS
jgi:hypothetical protein